MIASPLERLSDTHPDLEIWWDSSPLIYKPWVQKMLSAAEPSKRSILEEQLKRFYNLDDPANSLVRGCTTNPPLSMKAVQTDIKFWEGWVDQLINSNPGYSEKQLFWETYKEVVKRGAEMFLPIYTASKGRFGWISAQLDPRLFTEIDRMVHDAKELRAISPNVMIKVPASMQGIQVIETLTSEAISTNTTVCFTLPQIMASANAAMRGIALAEQRGVDLSKWRAVITMMIGRLTENSVLDLQAERRNIKLSWQDKHWFGIAVFRRAYRLLTDGGYASKMLACSMREGPTVAGKRLFWDIQKIAGGDIVYTYPPYILEPLWEISDNLIFRSEITEDVPHEVLDKLLKIPYCLQAYEPNGLELEQFNDHPSTVDTVHLFSQSSMALEEFVTNRKQLVKK